MALEFYVDCLHQAFPPHPTIRTISNFHVGTVHCLHDEENSRPVSCGYKEIKYFTMVVS